MGNAFLAHTYIFTPLFLKCGQMLMCSIKLTFYLEVLPLRLPLWNLRLPGGKDGGGRDREFGMDMYTLLYLKWITNKDLLCSTGNSAQYYVTT